MSFLNYKMGSKKEYMEREGFFYYEIHMKCARVIHYYTTSSHSHHEKNSQLISTTIQTIAFYTVRRSTEEIY